MRPTRREMLATTGAAAVLGVSPIAGASVGEELRRIPSSGEMVPAVGLGSWITFNVGGDPSLLDASTRVIEAFLDEGGGMIDSSPMYGSSQATIGHALDRLTGRARVFAADKVWTSSVSGGPAQMAETSASWGSGAFDLLQVHNLVSWEGHLETLFQMKQQGRLGHVGVTTSHGRRHGELERIIRDQPIDFVQLTYNPVDREVEDRLLPLAQERGIAVIVNRPFRRGALTERLAATPLPYFAPEIGAETWAQVILKYVLSHPAVTVAIPATTQVAHVRENKVAGRGIMPDPALRKRIAMRIAEI